MKDRIDRTARIQGIATELNGLAAELRDCSYQTHDKITLEIDQREMLRSALLIVREHILSGSTETALKYIERVLARCPKVYD